MSTLFGWCISGHHNACPVEVSSATGGLRCSCRCHDPAACKSGESPTRVADSGLAHAIMGAQNKTAPAVRQHCDSGASPISNLAEVIDL